MAISTRTYKRLFVNSLIVVLQACSFYPAHTNPPAGRPLAPRQGDWFDLLRFDGFLAVGDSGKMIRLNSYDEMLSFPYLIVAPLTAERHHSALQVAPLTAERHVPVLQVAPLTAERHHSVLQVAPLTAERHVPVLQVAPLTAESLGDPPPGVLLRRRARVSGGEYWGDAYAVDG